MTIYRNKKKKYLDCSTIGAAVRYPFFSAAAEALAVDPPHILHMFHPLHMFHHLQTLDTTYATKYLPNERHSPY
jgi:hypothetical protein